MHLKFIHVLLRLNNIFSALSNIPLLDVSNVYVYSLPEGLLACVAILEIINGLPAILLVEV
jgi:hypothetical protein